MAPIDQLILAIIAIGAILGLFHGFFREVVGTIGVLLAAIAANFVSPFARPVLGVAVSDETIAAIIVWIIVFLGAMFLLKKLASLLNHLFRSLDLGWLSRLAGALFGAVKYLLVVSVALTAVEFVCAQVPDLKVAQYLENSALVPEIHRLVGIVSPWFMENVLSPALNMLK